MEEKIIDYLHSKVLFEERHININMKGTSSLTHGYLPLKYL